MIIYVQVIALFQKVKNVLIYVINLYLYCYLYKKTKINNINEKVCIDTCEGYIILNYINNINECVEKFPSTYNFKLIDELKICLQKNIMN